MPRPSPRPGIMDIRPYVGGEGRAPGAARPVRLASNENPLGCSDKARAAYLAAVGDLHRYPDGAAAGLRTAIAEKHGMDPARIVCGAGSDEIISLLIRAYAGPGDEVVHSAHGFLMYAIGARAAGATPVAAPEKGLRTDPEAVLAAVTDRTKIVFLANPNNPTGSYLTRAELGALARRLPPRVLLVVDSAYAEYARAEDFEDGRALADAHGNAVMLRTFSKIYGLAALRLGWAYCSGEVADVLNRVRGPFNVSAPAQAAGVAALADDGFVRRSVETNDAGHAFLARALEELGIPFAPSIGNFILADFADRAEAVRLALRDRGVFVRQVGAYGLPRHLRITVGTEEDNKALEQALRAVT